MSACKSIGPLLDGYHDRELGSLERWRVDRHLAACPACRRDLASLDAVGALVRASVAGVPEPDVWGSIASQLPSRARTQAPPRRGRAARIRRTLLPGIAAAAAAAAAVYLVSDVELAPGDAASGASGVVRSVYAPSAAVMVLEAEKSDDPTIIWLMEPQPEIREVSTSVGI
ncbi:MAG: hypothetical protein DCC71_10475 [Proteobacteria bacterium]|nr:MAG: hypothetical protein DCC71_10475 [Pseudomonadota bacterium]